MKLDGSDDDPEESHDTPAERAAAGTRSTWVNVWLTITQVSVGLLSKSQGLVADGIHSLSDLVADFIVLFAGHHAKKDADDDHSWTTTTAAIPAMDAMNTRLRTCAPGMKGKEYGFSRTVHIATAARTARAASGRRTVHRAGAGRETEIRGARRRGAAPV